MPHITVSVPHRNTPVFRYLKAQVQKTLCLRKGDYSTVGTMADVTRITTAHDKVGELTGDHEGIVYQVPAVALMDEYWNALRERFSTIGEGGK